MITKLTSLTVLLILFLSGCTIQTYKTLPVEQHTFVKVYKVDMEKIKLYSKIQQWFALNLGKSNEALQIQDKEEGILIGKIIVPGGITAAMNTAIDLQMNIKVDIKDSKYRVVMSNFTFYYEGPQRLVAVGGEHSSSLNTARSLADEIHSYVIKSKSSSDF